MRLCCPGGTSCSTALRAGELANEDLLKALDDASLRGPAAGIPTVRNGARCSASPERG